MAFSPKVIWVAQWYPHEGDPYAGDFIQRHARAVALYMPVHLFACFPHTCNQQQTTTTNNLAETIIYFKPIKTGLPLLNKILLWRKWNQLLRIQIRQHIQKYDKPDLLHCHITLNAGWLGLWAKKKLNIPYLITEHWSGYMPGAFNGFDNYNRWSKKLFRKIIQQSSCVTTVSEALTVAMQRIENKDIYMRIPNVIDEAIFCFLSKPVLESNYKVLHISTFSKQKNIAAMLAAFETVLIHLPNTQFHIVGPKAKFQQLYPKQAVDNRYVLHGEISQLEIATLMQQCHTCVLYSHYETFGCVIIEANAVGLPVIVSDIPVHRELVHEGENGILVKPDSPNDLAATLIAFPQKMSRFQASTISSQSRIHYSFPIVGKQFFDLYQRLLSDSK